MKKSYDASTWIAPHLDRASQVNPSFNGDVVRGLQERPLQQEGQEQKHGQDIGVAKELLG